jgi:hypothetical protein
VYEASSSFGEEGETTFGEDGETTFGERVFLGDFFGERDFFFGEVVTAFFGDAIFLTTVFFVVALAVVFLDEVLAMLDIF